MPPDKELICFSALSTSGPLPLLNVLYCILVIVIIRKRLVSTFACGPIEGPHCQGYKGELDTEVWQLGMLTPALQRGEYSHAEQL